MKCQATSNTTHSVLISKEIGYKSYKEICSGETKKVNLAYYGNFGHADGSDFFKVENNSLVHTAKSIETQIHGNEGAMTYDWEVLSKFFSTHNIEPNWLDCDYSSGWYDDELGGWTGCMGKV